MKRVIVKMLFSFIASCLVMSGYAQQRTITGKVISEDGNPLAGVSYIVKGSKTGGTTKDDGSFSVTVSQSGAKIDFTYVGYQMQQYTVGSDNDITIVMKKSGEQLETVVVTALGIKREQRKLGYATTTIGAKDITRTAPTNFASALYGKAPGVMINTNPGGATSAVSIQIRGLSSITGQAQPLLVVDGVVIRNGDANNDGYWGGNQKINGNGLLDIDPENIESVNILKGAAASALYGSDANFGVIVITTKNGKGMKKGLGVDVNLSAGLEKAYIPDGYQLEYGPGYDRATNMGAFGSDDEGWIHLTVDGKDVVRPIFRAYANFGPKMDGREAYWWDGKMRPYKSHGNNLEDFYRTGYNTTANIALSDNSEKYNYRFSYTRNDYKGTQIGGDQQKNTFNLNASFHVTPKVSIDLVSNYSSEKVHNRPRQVYYLTNNYGGFVSPADYMDVYFEKYKTTKGYKWTAFNSNIDPEERLKYSIRAYDFLDFLWSQLANRYDETNTRLINSLTLNYKIIDGLTFRGRYGSDLSADYYEEKDRSTQPLSFGASGYYGTNQRRLNINYGDLLLTYKAKVTSKITVSPSVGYQARLEDFRYNNAGTRDGLTTENWFSMSASKTAPTSGSTSKTVLVKDGLFGILNVDYNNYLFVEGTIRQERSSTLYKDNNTYFYGGISGAFELSNAFNFPSFWEYSKLRASWGTVGNPAPLYGGNVVYNAGNVQGVPTLTPSSTYGNQKLKNERKDDVELGWENRFLGGRLGFDLTWYDDKIIDQILPLAIPSSSGANSILVNLGSLQSRGVELGIYGTPVKSALRWDTRLNLAFNNNKILSLMPDLDELTLSNLDNGSLFIKAKVGEKAGNILTYKRKKDAEGRNIIGNDGYYVIDYDNLSIVGNVQPKVVGGFINTVSYKNFSLNLVTDFRFGGQAVSAGLLYSTGAGVYDNSLFGRDASHGGLPYYIDADGNYVGVSKGTTAGPGGEKVYNDGMILKGVTADGKENTKIIDAPNFYLNSYTWGSWPGSGAVTSYNDAVFDNSFIKLREVALSYNLPQKFASRLKLQSFMVSVYGRNLFYFYKTIPYIDAEDAVGTNWVSRATNMGSGTAASRTMGISIRASF